MPHTSKEDASAARRVVGWLLIAIDLPLTLAMLAFAVTRTPRAPALVAAGFFGLVTAFGVQLARVPVASLRHLLPRTLRWFGLSGSLVISALWVWLLVQGHLWSIPVCGILLWIAVSFALPERALRNPLFVSFVPIAFLLVGVRCAVSPLAGETFHLVTFLRLGQSDLAMAWRIFAVALVMELNLIAHELGHLIAMRRAGWKIQRLRAGLLWLEAGPRGRLAPRLNRTPGLLFHGSVESAVHDVPHPADEMRIALAGPAVNLLLGLSGLALWRSHGPALSALGALLASFGLGTGVFNLLPLTPLGPDGRWLSFDGARFVDAWRSRRR